MIFGTFDIKKISKIANKVSEKFLLQVEGATCSGKSSFVSDAYTVLKRKGINVMIIEEAATKVLIENNTLLKQLITYPTKSDQWKKFKIELQQKVLSHQIEGLERFAENGTYTLAIMDRGGASTAYHTIPLVSGKDKILIEGICREIGKMSSQIFLLSPLGFLDRSSPRYQRTLEEIKVEYKGIKHYLNRWRLNYLGIASVDRTARVKIGTVHILALLNDIKR